MHELVKSAPDVEIVWRAFELRPEPVPALATGLGLSGESLLQALDTRQFETSVLDDEEQAGALGLTGVPAFVANRKAALTGVQPVKNLRQLVDHVR